MTTDEPRQPPAQHLSLRPVCPCGGHHAPQDADETRLQELTERLRRHIGSASKIADEIAEIERKRGRAA